MLDPINPRVPRSNLAVKTDASQLLVWIFPVRQNQTRYSIWQPCPPLEVLLIDLQYMRVTSFPFAGHGVVRVCAMAEISGSSGHADMILGLSHSSPHPVLGGQLGTGKYRSRFDLLLIISPMYSCLQLNWWRSDENLVIGSTMCCPLWCRYVHAHVPMYAGQPPTWNRERSIQIWSTSNFISTLFLFRS